jgi:hypothetical protein
MEHAANGCSPSEPLLTFLLCTWQTPSMMRRYAHLSDERLKEGEDKLDVLSQSPMVVASRKKCPSSPSE